MSRADQEDLAGQHRAAGNVLLGMGATGAVVGLAVSALGSGLPFLDAKAMGLTGLLVAAVGGWLRFTAEQQ